MSPPSKHHGHLWHLTHQEEAICSLQPPNAHEVHMDTGMEMGEQVSVSVTEPSSTEEELRRNAAMLALEVMHEIRNPLEALGHLTYLAHEEAHEPDQVRKYMRLAEEQVATLSRIASQTLGFARMSKFPKQVDLVALAEAALRIHQRTVEGKKIHLVKELPAHLISEVHSGLMLQAVSNLIINALDALPESGTLTVRLRQRQDGIHLVIADNGHGIPPDLMERVFEPFFTTKGEGGNGLGLPLTRRIIEDHRGQVRLRSSVRSGRSGTIFKISLPA